MNEFKTNAMPVDRLLELYEHHNFLYPAKLEKLYRVMPQIRENLKNAFTLPPSLYRTITYYQEQDDHFASIAAWKFTPTSMIILHLVSNQPLKTREIFLYHIMRLVALGEENVGAVLTYYQTKTRFAHNMFTHLHEQRVNDGVLIEPFHFYKQPLLPVTTAWAVDLHLEPLQAEDYPAFHQLLFQERGLLYLKALDLKPGTLTLEALNSAYEKANLYRKRVVLVAKDTTSGSIQGALLINQGSVGLHFSLIENSSELIVDEQLDAPRARRIARCLREEASSYYQKCPLGFMPLLVKSTQAGLMEDEGAELQRQYNLMICDRANFHNWTTYLLQQYKKSLNYASSESIAENKPHLVGPQQSIFS